MVVWSPLKFNCGREIANRFAMAPLTTDASHDDGTVTEHELEFVRRRAASGFGAAISSAAYVEDDGRSWQGIGAVHDGHLSGLHRLAEAMRAAGGLAILQIYDGGRIAKPELIDEQGLRAASAVASLRPGAQTPRAMTSDEVESLIASFREAARWPEQPVSTASRFTAPTTMRCISSFRRGPTGAIDHWGGTLARRMNFPLAVAQAVRDALGPELIAGFRVTPFEAEADGYTLEDSKLLCGELARLGLDYISVSLDDYRKSRPTGETRVYNGPVETSYDPEQSPDHGIRPRHRGPQLRCWRAAVSRPAATPRGRSHWAPIWSRSDALWWSIRSGCPRSAASAKRRSLRDCRRMKARSRAY